jgi:8-oxo-dGTP pyrophosphatase MutT (NUDIX family)
MWLFTTVGFFSVVQKAGTSTLTVRARVGEDLDRLRATYLPELGSTVKKGGSDYPFRATVSHDAFALGMARLVKAIDYPNFKDAAERIFGKARGKVYGKVWADLLALEEAPPPSKMGGSGAHRNPRKVIHKGRELESAFGGVVMDGAGRVLLFKPKGGFGGVVWSFPKGRLDARELPEACALREVLEETGVEARITGRVPGDYPGDVTLTRYFLMEPVRQTGKLGPEAERVAWVTPEEARAYIGTTPNRRSRERDLRVLEASVKSRAGGG